mmetsp:Transcript_1517/g.1725  ORF Transcript_1517/g.1725 Transcript_1517/m.1725 type:complete len:144 (+) Transcript_1517:281-712(+)
MTKGHGRNIRTTQAQNGAGGSAGSSDDEERGAGASPAVVPTTQRTSSRRQSRVDLSRLEASSLRKYRRVYKLGDLASGVPKEDLIPAVSRHFQQSMPVEDEFETILNFAVTLRKQCIQANGGGANGMAVAHKVKQKPGPKPRK